MTDIVQGTDPVRGLRLELDRPRHLRFTLGALRRIEEASGIGIEQQAELAEWSRTLVGVTTMLWAGLVHEDPDLTLEQVYEIVDIQNFTQVRAAIDLAVGVAMPPPVEGKDARPFPGNRAARRLARGPLPASNGITSGASGSTTSG